MLVCNPSALEVEVGSGVQGHSWLHETVYKTNFTGLGEFVFKSKIIYPVHRGTRFTIYSETNTATVYESTVEELGEEQV